MKRVLLAALAFVALLNQASSSLDAVSMPPLTFFQNYFLTGDYVVEGVGLRGTGSNGVASGAIVIDEVPSNVDIAAAFLYWQVVGSTTAPEAGARGVTFRGNVLSSTLSGVEEPFAKSLGTGTAVCSDGGASMTVGADSRTYTFRADVLRFLDIDPETGRLAANGSHAIELPDRPGLAALGASLVIVYRDPTMPLSGIVIYDGAAVVDQGGSQYLTMEGFYDADSAAKITHIVGNGQPDRSETVIHNRVLIATNPFASTAGPGWDNPTLPVTVDSAERAISTGIEVASNGDCVTWGAAIYRTTVKDSDGDGLLDIWESSTEPNLDPRGLPLPNLAAMGAQPNRKDLFIELGYMKTDVDTTYGTETKPAHSHLPSHEALKLVGDMFANAPGGPIAVHFDVGNGYPSGEADPYIIRGAGLARGGEAIDESVTVCTPLPGDPPWVCQFSAYPGTVGWKTGFRLLRDEVFGAPPLNPDGTDPCDTPGACVRRFDENRRGSFHYVLFTHALGLPKSELACLDATGTPVADVDDQCVVAPNPEFRVPVTSTGVADFPGGDAIVSLGAFADTAGLPIGTPPMQAYTLAHELGHNFERRHGGEVSEPNCRPAYLSVMNYLYQLRGLLDDEGKPHLDFAGSMSIAPIDETALNEGDSSFLPYRLGWYAPLATSYLNGRAPAARKHCDGSPIQPGEPAMVRIDARTAAGPLDWNADGVVAGETYAHDVNFNGRVNGGTTPPLGTSDDWANLRLDQIGTRRNVGGAYVIAGTNRFGIGPLSLSVGKGDLGKGDLGKGDLGKGDLGKGDLGKGDLGKGDLGKGDLGKGDLGKGDLGGGDLFGNDPNNPEGELDFETATDLARTPPNEFTACVAGVTGCDDLGAGLHDVVTTWTTPNVGGVGTFTLYRVDGDTLTAGQLWTPVVNVTANSGQEAYTAVDTTELVDGATYTYFSVAIYADGIQSDPSNVVTITAVNAPAIAGNDAYATNEDTPLTVPANGVLANDSDPDSDVTLTAQLVQGPSHGSLDLAANGSFVYTPAADYHGPDAFTYRAVSGSVATEIATVTIDVVSVNDIPGAFHIANQTIDQDTSTGPLPFSIVDEDVATVTVTGASNDPVLVPNGNIVFGGSGAARTVRVTPAAGRSGTAVIAVTAIDAEGAARQVTFTLTVRAVGSYQFVNVLNAPPAYSFKTGSLVPFMWKYVDKAGAVASGTPEFAVTVQGPGAGGRTRTFGSNGPGGIAFEYLRPWKTWAFLLLLREPGGAKYPVGVYNVTITPSDSRYASTTFQIRVVK